MSWSNDSPAPTAVTNAAHLSALEWFMSRAGTEVPWPAPHEGMFLVNKAKGIHKPAQLSYALSVRQSLSGPYADSVSTSKDGTWVVEYNQEGDNPQHFTNQALAKCMADKVPVGVLIQVKPKPGPKYKVLGLGAVTSYMSGRFVIEQYDKDPDSAVGAYVADQDFRATNIEDARKRELRAIAIRRGQPAFRSELLAAYKGRCAISGCSVKAVLEAAHIIAYKGEHTNHVQNGLLLRSDLHTLFDLGLITVDPAAYKVSLAADLSGSQYAGLQGAELLLPDDRAQWPSREALAARLSDR